MSECIIQESIFRGKQNIPWMDVERYLKKYVGKTFSVKEYGDAIQIGGSFPNEFSESKDTKRLRGALAKVKANAAQIIDELIVNATNRRWVENKNEKHQKNAIKGWYRYDVSFGMVVQTGREKFVNHYRGTLVVRINDRGNYLYDLINIKREARTPLES